MKVAIFIDSLLRGGAERQALATFVELRRRGVDATLIHYYDEPDGYVCPGDAARQVLMIPRAGGPIRLVWRLAKFLRQRRFDVIHALKDTPNFYGCLGGWLAGVPVRLASHRVQVLPRGRYLMAYRVVNRLATAWIGNSQAVVDTLASEFDTSRERLHVVFNGVEPERLKSSLSREAARARLGLPVDAGVVTMVAMLRRHKNHAMFVRMAGRLIRTHPRTVFLLVGRRDPSEPTCEVEVRSMAQSEGLDERVMWLGQRGDVPDILAATDVSVLTSNYEGMSNALLESMAAGVSVVSTAHPGADEVIDDGQQGFLVPLNDDAAMAARVGRLLDDPPLRAAMGHQGMARVAERFSVRAMGEHLVRLYGELLDRVAGRRAQTTAFEDSPGRPGPW